MENFRANGGRSEEHTSELQSHSEISYAVFCLKKKNKHSSRSNNPAFPSGLGTATSLSSERRRSASRSTLSTFFFFFFNDTATTEIYTNLNTLSLHDALPISPSSARTPSTRPRNSL